MKRTEIYRLDPKLKGTETEELISKKINQFLRQNYLELNSIEDSIQYLHMKDNSLLLITYGRDICKDIAVEIQVAQKETSVPKELSELLVFNGFMRIQK